MVDGAIGRGESRRMLGRTEGTALRMIVEHLGGAAGMPLYAGDDAKRRRRAARGV